MSNKIEMKSISELTGYNLFIPSYQRGYRWTKQQVNDLLNDLEEFRKSSNSLYCLQPIVVAKRDKQWEVLDGQQRLTTIFLILSVIRSQVDTRFSLSYETRKDSEAFLESIHSQPEESAQLNIDFWHMKKAYNTIVDWFENSTTKMRRFANVFESDEAEPKNVQFIWYDVTDELPTGEERNHAIDIFTRINIGKIRLTNGELIKALLLNSKGSTNDVQIKIASEWDFIEKTLQNDAIWYFMYNETNKLKYTNRIEYILDLMKGKTPDKEDHHTFYQFFDEQKKGTTNEQIWQGIKDYTQILLDWYNDTELFHLIGFLIANDHSIRDLIDESLQCTKKNFLMKIKDRIRLNIGKDDLSKLEYGDAKVRKVLLMFNIQTILQSKESIIRFPFHFYKNNKSGWDIEHIRSQTAKSIDKAKRKEWAADILHYFVGYDKDLGAPNLLNEVLDEKVKVLCSDLKKLFDAPTINESEFNDVYKKCAAHFGEDTDIEEVDGIGNLALLDAATNRSYGNAFFPVKRKTIIDRDSTGIYVPLCTKNVFLKSYSFTISDMMSWNKDDAADYANKIQETLSEYLPSMTIEGEQ